MKINSKKLKKIDNIYHAFFSRKGGVSQGIYKSLNCGLGSKDFKNNVSKNLEIVKKQFYSQNINLLNLIISLSMYLNAVSLNSFINLKLNIVI